MASDAAERNIELFHRAHEAFERGDSEAMRSWFADDFVWHELGHNPLSGDYRGADDVLGLFGRIVKATDGHFDTRLVDLVANDSHRVALLRFDASAGGKSMSTPRVSVYRLNPNGRGRSRSASTPGSLGQSDRPTSFVRRSA